MLFGTSALGRTIRCLGATSCDKRLQEYFWARVRYRCRVLKTQLGAVQPICVVHKLSVQPRGRGSPRRTPFPLYNMSTTST